MEKGRRKDWESRKGLERSWSLGPKQDPHEILPGKPYAPEGVKGNKSESNAAY
jgi:hypothetical protein